MKIKNLSLIFIILTFLTKPVLANFDVNARTAIVQDYLSGKILFEKDADRQIFPASMTKIMTSIIAFDLLKSGELSLEDKFLVLKMHGDCLKLDILQCLLWLEMK